MGYAIDNWMPYVTGGLALGDIHTKFEDGPATDSKSQVKAGWTLGAGVAYAINKNWFAQVDYRYTDFGKVTTATTTTDSAFVEHEHVKTNEVRIGIAYKF
ncbi:porin family protein [Mesorhizobium sp. M2E.F.Ca.ET.209.01.1.1]|nr:porin family protein [Mesorhizobium sp. M2E.F.Ca.ET.209.01.1.1]